MTFYDFIFLCMKKAMMTNRFGFRELIAEFDNAANTKIILNQDEDLEKKSKKNKNAIPVKEQPPVS